MESPATKTCYNCGEPKPATREFWYGDRRAKDKMKTECKACFLAMGKRWAQANKDKINARQRERAAAKRKPKPLPRSLIVGLKVCRECGMVKPTSDYCADKKSRDRLRYECKACQRAWRFSLGEQARRRKYEKAWREVNRDRVNAAARSRRAKEPEKHRERYRQWRAENPEIARTARRRWYQENRERAIAAASLREAQRRGAEGQFTPSDIERIYKDQSGRCAGCHKKLGKKFHRDHILPISKGGTSWPNNIQLLCEFCNLSKKDRDPIDFMQSRGLLL